MINDRHDGTNPGPKQEDGCMEDTSHFLKDGKRAGNGSFHGPCGTMKDKKRVFLCEKCCDKLGKQ